MGKIVEIWATIKQLITSRTIWGVIIMLASGIGIDLNGVDVALTNTGDSIMTAIGALLALVGYLDRRPKPVAATVKLGS